MALRFCQKCKTLMRPHKKDNEFFMKCDGCGFVEKIGSLISNEKIKKEYKGQGVVDKGNVFAGYNNICKKCGYDKAEIIDAGVFYSDEDNLFLLKCGRCGFSERIGKRAT